MKNLEYIAIYDEVNEDFEDAIKQFWSERGNLSMPQVIENFNQIVIVIYDTDSIIELNKTHTIDEYGNTLDIHGNRIFVRPIVGFSYVNRHYLTNDELYYFYGYFIPDEEFNTEEYKCKLYQTTREYLSSLLHISDYADRGNYLGIILQDDDICLIDKFNFIRCNLDTSCHTFPYYQGESYVIDKFN